MLEPTLRFKPRDNEVAAKVMDGEAIIINISSGIYYSMDNAGGLIWEMIERGHSVAEIAAAVESCYAIPREQARMDVECLFQELTQEDLIVPFEDGQPREVQKLPGAGETALYQAPRLNVYRDMGDLLALDPPTPGLGETVWEAPDGKIPE